jgi:hypothetical protein
MKRQLFIALVTLAGCGEIAGIEDLTSDEKPDSGTSPPIDAGPDVVTTDAGADTTPAADATEADKGFRRVFVTSGAYAMYPNMGPGVADTQCQKAALDPDAGLAANGESWIAWLSAGNVRAVDRLPFAGEYRLIDGTPVVSKRGDLTSGALLHAIDLNEKGLAAEGDNDQRRVWTGTAANGNIANECNAWTAGGNLGQFGRAYLSTGAWTDNGFTACGISLRLYCFEK